MLQLKEVDKLFQILNTKEQSLEEIEGQFLVTYNETLPVFKASNTLNHLLSHNLLTHQQRIIALFLLIQNYKSEGIKKNPFGATILNISQSTNQGFQRKMISDLIIQGKRQQYATLNIEQLFDDEQLVIELTEQRPQIKKMRDEFVNQLPKISQSRRIQLHNVLPQASEKNKKVYPPQQCSLSAVKDKNFGKGGFNIGVMRPIPNFIEITGFQMDWLAPGVVADVHWDNSVDVEKKLAKCKALIKKGLQSKLSKQQSTEIDRSLQNQAYAVLNLDLTPQNLILLINNNPYVAVSFLIKLGNYSIIGDYLQSLLDCSISLNCIDVVVRLIKVIKLPGQFIEAFTLKNLKQSQSIPENHKDRGKMARVISKFIVALVKNEVIEYPQIVQQIKAFLHYFKDLQEIQLLDNLLNNGNHENEEE